METYPSSETMDVRQVLRKKFKVRCSSVTLRRIYAAAANFCGDDDLNREMPRLRRRLREQIALLSFLRTRLRRVNRSLSECVRVIEGKIRNPRKLAPEFLEIISAVDVLDRKLASSKLVGERRIDQSRTTRQTRINSLKRAYSSKETKKSAPEKELICHWDKILSKDVPAKLTRVRIIEFLLDDLLAVTKPAETVRTLLKRANK
jgi:hypothetical protein